ncbi:ABC-2 type transport system permease protein [Austwickia chelonae]|uniref:Putative transporter n=1 Tax=Austwickia chelonae NBRC 105200 TaxID=1184607 RepID=K6VU85_9MICO|nr:ABC transporter permease [Austwickia chelonae]GAB78910.1 putative transporter [Austwickia chelonae NBRC 105200]SEV86391.1 ABC-2 type transport system permease protein [Austwickia chelonae]
MNTVNSATPGGYAPTPSMQVPGGTVRGAIVRGAFRHAGVELRIQFCSRQVMTWLYIPITGLLVLWFLRDIEVRGSAVSVTQMGISGLLAMSMIFGALVTPACVLMNEQEDGTLLRAKAVPGGMPSHLLGTLLITIGTTLVPMMLTLVLASLLVPSIAPTSAGAWWTITWVSLLALSSCVSWGAVLGAWIKDVSLLGIALMAVYANLVISGIFYPIAALPTWLQYLGQVLPTYWIGLGYRSAMLPPEAVALEVGGSWNLGLTVLVLASWTVIGFILAPMALRRLTRRQSGSRVAAARDRVMSQGY